MSRAVSTYRIAADERVRWASRSAYLCGPLDLRWRDLRERRAAIRARATALLEARFSWLRVMAPGSRLSLLGGAVHGDLCWPRRVRLALAGPDHPSVSIRLLCHQGILVVEGHLRRSWPAGESQLL